MHSFCTKRIRARSTIERVSIPRDLVACVDGRSSIGRLAIVVHGTAGFIDPGLEGQIALELSNIGRIPVRFVSRHAHGTDRVSPDDITAERPYGPERGSQYSGQKGQQASRIRLDGVMRAPSAGTGAPRRAMPLYALEIRRTAPRTEHKAERNCLDVLA